MWSTRDKLNTNQRWSFFFQFSFHWHFGVKNIFDVSIQVLVKNSAHKLFLRQCYFVNKAWHINFPFYRDSVVIHSHSFIFFFSFLFLALEMKDSDRFYCQECLAFSGKKESNWERSLEIFLFFFFFFSLSYLFSVLLVFYIVNRLVSRSIAANWISSPFSGDSSNDRMNKSIH